MSRSPVVLVLLLAALAGCSTPAPAPDAGRDSDAATDAAVRDDGSSADAPSSDGGVDGGVDPTACTGAVFHVAPGGDDDMGDGSEAHPFRTLAHATASVSEPGATIHLAAGEYLETTSSHLAAGVCLDGEGAASIVRSTLTAQYTAIVIATSPAEGTLGAQSITNLAFDGDLSTQWAIEIRGRSAVSIHDCSFVDFFDSAVVWGGRIDGMGGPPGTFATGNSFHHNVVTNSAFCDAVFCRGALYLGGQEGMTIHDNVISTTGRADGSNGWPIKAQVDGGHVRGLRIFDNTLTASNSSTFDFAIELFNVTGTEVYDNTIIGSIDTNEQFVGAPYTFSFRAYRNDVSHTTVRPDANTGGGNTGLFLEGGSVGSEIFENHIHGVTTCVVFVPRASSVTDVSIHHNRCEGIVGGGGRAVNFLNFDPFVSARVAIDHNVFIADPASDPPPWGINLPTAGGANDLWVRNNVIAHFSQGAVTANPGSSIAHVAIEHNTFFDCGGGGMPVFAGGDPTDLVLSGTLTSDPLLDAELRPADASPVIDTGIEIAGRSFLGAAPDRGWVEVR